MSEKKVVRKNVAITIGIICIILGAFLVGTTIYFTSTINSTITDLNDTVNLRKHTVWVNNETVSQTAGNYTSWTFSANSANVSGYILVSFLSSTTNNTYVRVIYSAIVNILHASFYAKLFDSQIGPPYPQDEVFPVVPPYSHIEVRVGNTNRPITQLKPCR